MLFDARSLKNEFSRHQLESAERFLANGRVESLRISADATRLDGTLIDTHGHEERPFIAVRPQGNPLFNIECSCESASPCVHGIALLMHSLLAPAQPPLTTRSKKESTTPLTLHYALSAHDCWPPRLQLSLSVAQAGEPLRPLVLNWDWLKQQRENLRRDDWRLLQQLRDQDASWEGKHRLDLKSVHLGPTLPTLVSSRRCYWATENNGNTERQTKALQHGPARVAQTRWAPQENGQQWLELRIPGVDCYPGPTPFYVDTTLGQIGHVTCPLSIDALRWLERGVVVPAGEYATFMQRYCEDLRRTGLPEPIDYPVKTLIHTPIPCMRFYSLRTHLIAQQSYRRPALIDAIRVSFAYPGPFGDIEFLAEWHQSLQYRYNSGTLYKIIRDRSEEQHWLSQLEHALLSLTPLEHFYHGAQFTDGVMPGDLCVNSAQEWQRLLLEQVPTWQQEGWRITVAPQFRHYFVAARQWRVNLERDTQGRFALGMTATIGGETLNLLPRLANAIAATPERYTDGALSNCSEGSVLSLGDDRRVVVPLSLLRPLLNHLLELFDQPKLDRLGRLALPATQLERLNAMADALDRYWHDPQSVAKGAIQLSFDEGVLTNAYDGLNATLRDYQIQGVAWWRNLARRELGGILADDMGLGKTLQTLAFLLQEKNNGRLHQPALVVAPTSVIYNWQIEAKRFTPTLSCIVLHGTQRMEILKSDIQADIFVTSYALAHRDLAAWQQRRVSYLVLDEAHMIKNANTKVAKALRQFEAEHRFCLTGTPLENHLGELWSLFEFMMPGSLGSEPQFKRLYRIPIEKRRDEARAAALLRRIAPHLLRRKKSDVATELPPKTEMVVHIAMGEVQGQFYEALHATTQKEILRLLNDDKGEQRRIHVLDALLRLRQLCCDPRLLPLEACAEIPSAKLEHLLNMVQELNEEGRKILVFSQFTSMLKLISQGLQILKITHLMLTGATQNRQALVERFQTGDDKIFLISLKAGGVGLNLTAADTVIHFDPWWNPAAEQQATDRAYRIGQDKPVFVYKLICQNTIEEKIVILQENKRALQDAITGAAELLPATPLSDQDIQFMLSQSTVS